MFSDVPLLMFVCIIISTQENLKLFIDQGEVYSRNVCAGRAEDDKRKKRGLIRLWFVNPFTSVATPRQLSAVSLQIHGPGVVPFQAQGSE